MHLFLNSLLYALAARFLDGSPRQLFIPQVQNDLHGHGWER